MLKKTVTNKTVLLINIALVILLIIISLFPRLWELTIYPPIIVDESAYLRDINKLINVGGFHPVAFQWDFSQATLLYYPTILLLNLLKTNNQLFALRLVSVIFSLLSLIPFFFIMKKHSNSLIAFCITLLFSYSYYYLQFSRVGWGVIYSTTLGLYLIWVLKLAVEKHSKLLFIISGILSALTLYTYRAGEIYIAAGIVLLCVELFFLSGFKTKEKLLNVLFFLIAFVAISFPWLNQIINNQAKYQLRERVVSILNTSYPYHNSFTQISVFLYQIAITLKSWILFLPVNGNAGNFENTRYLPLSYPPITPILIPLFLMGLILAIKNLRYAYTWLFILLFGLIFGQIMTIHPPNGARGLIVLPAIYFFIGLFLNLLYQKLKNFPFINLLIISFSIIVAIMDFIYYKYWMSWIKV